MNYPPETAVRSSGRKKTPTAKGQDSLAQGPLLDEMLKPIKNDNLKLNKMDAMICIYALCRYCITINRPITQPDFYNIKTILNTIKDRPSDAISECKAASEVIAKQAASENLSYTQYMQKHNINLTDFYQNQSAYDLRSAVAKIPLNPNYAEGNLISTTRTWCANCWLCTLPIYVYTYDYQGANKSTSCGQCEHIGGITASVMAGMLRASNIQENYMWNYANAHVHCNQKKLDMVTVVIVNGEWVYNQNMADVIVDEIIKGYNGSLHSSEYEPISLVNLNRDTMLANIKVVSENWCIQANKNIATSGLNHDINNIYAANMLATYFSTTGEEYAMYKAITLTTPGVKKLTTEIRSILKPGPNGPSVMYVQQGGDGDILETIITTFGDKYNTLSLQKNDLQLLFQFMNNFVLTINQNPYMIGGPQELMFVDGIVDLINTISKDDTGRGIVHPVRYISEFADENVLGAYNAFGFNPETNPLTNESLNNLKPYINGNDPAQVEAYTTLEKFLNNVNQEIINGTPMILNMGGDKRKNKSRKNKLRKNKSRKTLM